MYDKCFCAHDISVELMEFVGEYPFLPNSSGDSRKAEGLSFVLFYE